MPVALVSVSDKTGLEEFCAGLVERGWEIVSTSGTRNVLLEAGFEVKEIGELTGHPEMLAGRVKRCTRSCMRGFSRVDLFMMTCKSWQNMK